MKRKAQFIKTGQEVSLEVWKDSFGYTNVMYVDETGYAHTAAATNDTFVDANGKPYSRPRLIKTLAAQLGVKLAKE